MVDGKQLYFPDDKEYVIYSAKLTETLSCASEFEFVMPSCNPMYDSLEERVSMVQILRNGKEIFYGEVREVNETINKEKSVYCVDEFAFLYDSVQPQARFQNVTPAQFFREILNVHNAKVEPKKRFQAGIVTVTDSNDSIYRYTNGEDTLTAIRKKLCEPLNGYLRKRKEDGITYIDLVNLSDYGVSSVQPVEFGQNLLKYSSKRNGTEIVTVCVPRGARLESQEVKGLDAYVSISSVNDGKNYVVNQKALEHYGWIEKLVEWDDVTQPANLKKKAQEWVDNNQYKILSLELKAVDLAELNANLDPYEVGDMIQAIAEPFGMDAWFPLAKKVTNINDSITNDVTLSYDVKLSYAQNQNIKFENMEQAIPQSTNILESAKENASALIKNSAEGNIFTVYDENRNPKELLIMDTNDIKTAKKVWRWNINGLGYSSTGYNGEYGLAMTMDGAIVADFITTGKLSTDRLNGQIKAGSNVTIEWDAIENQPEIPNKISDLENDSNYVNKNQATSISKNEIKTAKIECSQLNGGTVSLGGSKTAPANLKLFNKYDELIGLWNEDGMYSKSNIVRYSEFSDIADFTYPGLYSDDDIRYLYRIDSNGHKICIKSGTMRVYLIITDDSSSTLETSAIDYDTKTSSNVYYNRTYTISKTTCAKCFPSLSSNLEEYYALEQNQNAYYIDIDMMQIENDLINKDIFGYINYIAINKPSETARIAGIRFIDRKYENKTTETVIQYEDIFIKNSINVHAKQIQIDTLRNEIDIGDIEIKPDVIELYPDSKIVGKKPIYYASFNGVAFWEDAMQISTEKIIHKSSYGNISSTSGAKALYIKNDGTIISSSSSRRYKDNITYEPKDCDFENLYKLSVAEYKYKEEYGGGDLELGLIAEDVAELFPKAAIYDENGQVESWNERTMIPAMLKLIQDQNKRIKQLERITNE